jgi:signal transduction histidine kinase
LLPKVWEKFFKIDTARNRTYGGTGLGLSIVRVILQHHEAEFGARNVEGGILFWFSMNKYLGEY